MSEATGRGKGQELYRFAKECIPGGTQLLSKRPEMFLPEGWPSYYARAAGVEVWDLDGNRFVDMSYTGIGSTILGFADPDVNQAVKRAIDAGSMATLNCPEEVDLARVLCELHPWADMVRYTRAGGEAMAVAVRIARARSGRDRVAFCGYHGWHDWYLAANLAEGDALDGHLLPGLPPSGVPRALRGTAVPFEYNRLAQLEAIAARHGAELAAIVMEPMRGVAPAPGFLERVRAISHEIGAILVFDEITSAFRLTSGGIHLMHGIEPDIAVFAKAISNGYPMAAVIGRREVMQAAQDSFISSTSWTERIGPTAALATIEKYRRCDVSRHLVQIGQQVKQGWEAAASSAGLQIEVGGIDPLAHFRIETNEADVAHTLFTQLMLDRGFLAGKAFYASYAHRQTHVDEYLEAVEDAFGRIAAAIASETLGETLRGPVAHAGFHRLTS